MAVMLARLKAHYKLVTSLLAILKLSRSQRMLGLMRSVRLLAAQI
jgi:hypothetical protein